MTKAKAKKIRITAEEKQIHKAHDLFLKATFMHLWAIQAFFRAYIPAYLRKSVDFDSIRPIRESHILSSLKKLENDLVFTCKINGRLAILIVEHQSTADSRMTIRFLKYATAIIDEYMATQPAGTPWPLILNFCIYHSKLNKPYPYATNSQDCLSDAQLAEAMDVFIRFNLINISILADNIIESHGVIGLLEKLFKYCREQNILQILEYELERNRDWILGLNMSVAPLGLDYWQFIFSYMLNVLDPACVSEEELVNLFEEKLFINKEKIMITIHQQIEKEVEKRVEKRVEEKKAMEVAKAMFTKGLAADLIQEVTRLPQQAIDQLRRSY